MKKLILLSGCLLVLASCSLFKNRTVQKEKYSIDSTHTYDSTAASKWKEEANKVIQTDTRATSLLTRDYDWIIETDTGIIQFDPLRGFIGRAKSVRGTGKTSLARSNIDQSKESTSTAATGENKTKVVEKERKVIKESAKAVESKLSAKAITWLALLVFILVIIGLAYWKKQRKLASIV